MSKGCCNDCGYKADYIIDNNNYLDRGYKDFLDVPHRKTLCGACLEKFERWVCYENNRWQKAIYSDTSEDDYREYYDNL